MENLLSRTPLISHTVLMLHKGGGTERDGPTVGRKRSLDHCCCAPGASFHAVPEGHAGNRHPPWRNTRTEGIPPTDPP